MPSRVAPTLEDGVEDEDLATSTATEPDIAAPDIARKTKKTRIKGKKAAYEQVSDPAPSAEDQPHGGSNSSSSMFVALIVAVLCFVPHSNRAPENAGPNR